MPKGKFIETTTKRTYSLERLQKLRHDADIAGDTTSRDILAAKIVAQGGVIPTGEIPVDETELSKLVRLRREAEAAGDTDTYEALAAVVSEYEQESECSRLLRQLSEAIHKEQVDRIKSLTQRLTEVEIADYERYLREAREEEDALGIEVFGEELVKLRRDGYQGLSGDYSSKEGMALKDALDKKLPSEEIRELLEAYKHRHDLPDEPHAPHKSEKQVAREAISDAKGKATRREITELRKVHNALIESDSPMPASPINNGQVTDEAMIYIEQEALTLEKIPGKNGLEVDIGEVLDYMRDSGMGAPYLANSLDFVHPYGIGDPHSPHEGKSLVDTEDDLHKLGAATEPPTNGGMNVHTPPESDEEQITLGKLDIPGFPPASRESDEERREGPEATESINNGTASVNAKALIKSSGFDLAEIPARFSGKVDVIDVKNYKKLLTAV